MLKLNKAQFFLALMLYCDHDGQGCDGWDRKMKWRRYQEESDDFDSPLLADMLQACKEEGIDLKELA